MTGTMPATPVTAVPPASPATPATPGERAGVADLADHLVHLVRSFGRAKARLLAAAEHDVEWSAQLVLRHLQNEGPMRAGAIAETLHSDPSTVSRQVAALVKDGLLERRADPMDGRASLLVLTDKAHGVLEAHNRVRLDYFAQLLTDWSDDEIHDFATLLDRFNTAYDSADHDWLRERLIARPRSNP